jgi:hypothetical protein
MPIDSVIFRNCAAPLADRMAFLGVHQDHILDGTLGRAVAMKYGCLEPAPLGNLPAVALQKMAPVTVADLTYTLQYYVKPFTAGGENSWSREGALDGELYSFSRQMMDAQSHTEAAYRAVGDTAKDFITHTMPNSIDTLYEAIDLEQLSQQEAKISLKITVKEGTPKKLRVEIEDNGLGFDPKILSKLRDGEFCSTKDPSRENFMGGRGQGLKVFVFASVIESNGTISIETRHHTGSYFLTVKAGSDGRNRYNFGSTIKITRGTLITAEWDTV